jgi:polar amino acid transport system substrate-binding protein
VRRSLTVLVLLLALGLIAGCGSKKDSSSATTVASLADCKGNKLATKSPGRLTVATDKPAYPPYFIDDDPTNGKGFESAVAYGIAGQLGIPKSKVKWTVEPFNSSYAPGPKSFDFDVNQISITDQRAKAVDFSSPYYKANQAVVALKGSDVANAKTLKQVAKASIGVQVGTTSLDAVDNVINPDSPPKVFNNSNDVVTALKQGQIDAIVVDLPTALYITAAQVPDSVIVGQFAATGGDQFGALLAKDSALTPCVSFAINAMRKSGQLKQITTKWMSQAANAPQLK